METGIELIARARAKQLEKGWSLEHDQQHGNGELLKAAETYIMPEHYDNGCLTRRERLWPFNTKFTGGESRIDELAKAGALIAAEIDRLLLTKETEYERLSHTLAIGFIRILDENRPDGKMNLSNGECTDIELAFKNQDWTKLAGYVKKYTNQEDKPRTSEEESDDCGMACGCCGC